MTVVQTSHVAEATKALGNIRGVDPATNAITIAMEAQVHATLALVEQQRLANIIALAHVADASDTAVTPLEKTAWEALGITGSGEMRPDVKKALGLS